MTPPPTLSVIIDTHNQADFIERAVESVLGQRLPAAEVIVVDDGSTDTTVTRLQRFAGRIRVITQQNLGQAGALNTGIAEARGDWLAFLDGDDAWAPDHLGQVAGAIAGADDLDAVLTPLTRIDAADRPLGDEPSVEVRQLLRALAEDSGAAAGGRYPWFPPTSGLALRRDWLRGLGSIPGEYRIAADGWLQVAIAVRARRIAVAERGTAMLRVHGANRWTGRRDDDVRVVAARAQLYRSLVAAAESLAADSARDVSGLCRSLRSQAEEFALWEQVLSGERVRALALAWRWTPPAFLTARAHRGFRRATLLLAALLPVGAFMRLRRGWRGRRAEMP